MSSQHKKPWSSTEIRLLLKMVSYYSWNEIAERLGRRSHGCRRAALRFGGKHADILRNHHNVVNMSRLAKMLGRCTHSIAQWCALGLQYERMDRTSNNGAKLFNPRKVRLWMMCRPNVLLFMHPARKRLWRVTPADIEAAQIGAA